MKTETNYYRKQVEYYFEYEYSDSTIEESIDNILKVESKPKEYWIKKVDKVVGLYSQAKKHPSDAAEFIARLFRPRLKSLIKDVF